MKHLILNICIFTLISLSPVIAEASKKDTGKETQTKNDSTMEGSYVWERGKKNHPGEIKAVFTKRAKEKYDVSFYFNFRKKPHVYTGTAEGNLENGTLKGSVKNDNKKRSFTFAGNSKDGKFKGTHQEITRGEKKTGTIQLSLVSSKK